MKTNEPKRINGDTFERLLEKTPNGADYSEIRYYNEKMIPCKKEYARQCVILEKMNDGIIVKTTYGFIKK